jgi:hypothetical protein
MTLLNPSPTFAGIYAAPQQSFACAALPEKTPAKFADELSAARHFKIPLYPIEGHLA